MADRPQTIDEYLAQVANPAHRAALEQLRTTIHALAPGVTECITYGHCGFKLGGRMLVSFAAAKQHCALYPWSAATIEAHADLLADYSTSAGTIRFQPQAPLPEELLRTLLAARIAENDGRDAQRAAKRAAGRSHARPAE